MITFIAFILTIFGSINWLLIGLLQYDFIAGLFGFQASIFSRLIYILFGSAAIYLIIRIIVNRGTFKIFERRKKKNKAAPIASNVEASKEQMIQTNQNVQQDSDNLFDEHFENKS